MFPRAPCLSARSLYTPVPVLNRQLSEPDTLGGHLIPAGTSIILSLGSLHMSPSIWGADVATFRPERFLPEESRGRHPFAYAPFALGARNCIGQNLAITEAKVILGRLLQVSGMVLAAGSVSGRQAHYHHRIYRGTRSPYRRVTRNPSGTSSSSLSGLLPPFALWRHAESRPRNIYALLGQWAFWPV